MTLIEVLIVVAILSLLSAAIAVAVVPMWSRTQIDLAQDDARTLRGIAMQWRVVHGAAECPTVGGLVRERMLDSAANRVDPWNQPFRILCEESELIVASSGPDKREGTDDDIVVPRTDAKPEQGASPAPPEARH